MKFQGAVIKEQRVTFVVVIVKKHILDRNTEADKTLRMFQPIFPGIPIVLMAQDFRGVPTYYGRRDIYQFMANIPIQCVPWKEYTLS
ncbi:hypothetical protein [Scytonema sp. NUACC26]|uniref:hypothetical protein n=1 Tax=Scytonema sp. NUACC26 TaxID=3140176 RepID=UPI0034DCB945